jgi:hypothetical protein
MRPYKSVVFALVAFALGAVPATAQDAIRVEVTPYVALGSAGASPVGAAITFPVTSILNLETDVAYRRGEGRIHALSSSTNLLWSLPRVGQSTPYVAAGVGLSQYGTPVVSSNGVPIGTQPRVALTMNAGGGLKTSMNEDSDFLWPSGIGAVSRRSRHLVRCRQTVASPPARAAMFFRGCGKWCALVDSNHRPPPCEGGALPLSQARVQGRTSSV